MRIVLRTLLILVAAACGGHAWANAVADMRLIGDDERTRFVVDLQASPEYAISRLSNPDRLVIDLPDVEFEVPEKSSEGRGLVSDFRFGQIAEGKARIVLDLARPVEVVNTFVLDPVSPEPARLVVDLAPTTTENFRAAVESDRPQRVRATPRDYTPRVESGLPVVVIDPGHGGIDSGAVGADGLLEKDVTLEFGRELARRLKEGGRLEPILTREKDAFLSLGERMDVGRQHHAALFISIHADTVRQDYVRGATVYTLSDDASDELAAALAERENRSDILAGLALDDQPDDVANILFDLARRETRNLSVRFAKALVDDMKDAFELNSNPWRRASFKVLKAPEVPSVLLELGYLSNSDDEAMFRSEEWPEDEARTIARAVEEFLDQPVAASQPIR
jgi:N-acetylmuramoyl-L-alanine amidase